MIGNSVVWSVVIGNAVVLVMIGNIARLFAFIFNAVRQSSGVVGSQ